MAAAASHDIRKELLSIMICSVCCETYNDPRHLPCFHSYCLKCIWRISRPKLAGGALACPLCWKEFNIPENGIAGLPKNAFVEQLKDLALPVSTHGPYCDICSSSETEAATRKRATFFYVNSSKRLCWACADLQRQMEVSRGHELVREKHVDEGRFHGLDVAQLRTFPKLHRAEELLKLDSLQRAVNDPSSVDDTFTAASLWTLSSSRDNLGKLTRKHFDGQSVSSCRPGCYYIPGAPFASAGGRPTGRDAAAAVSHSYGTYMTMAADYMNERSTFGQYDYNVSPGFDYGVAARGASAMQVQEPVAQQKGTGQNKYGDPTGSASNYEVDSSNGVTGMNDNTIGIGSGVSVLEESVKLMKINSDDDGVVDYRGNAGASSGSYSGPVQTAASTKKSWANIASQSARRAGWPKKVRPSHAPVRLAKGDVGAGLAGLWENQTGLGQTRSDQAASGIYSGPSGATSASVGGSHSTSAGGARSAAVPTVGAWTDSESFSSSVAFNAVSQYNPTEFDVNPETARFFVIKSFSEDDILRSIKYGIWSSTEYGNKRLDTAFREREGKGPIYLFSGVNGSGQFCGVAQMLSPVDYQKTCGIWANAKCCKGLFEVRWIYVKDVPNSQLRHITLENNEGKPITNSRDTQEVPLIKGKQVLWVIHHYRHTSSILDDFQHSEEQQL